MTTNNKNLSLVQILNEVTGRGDISKNLELCKQAIKSASNMSFLYSQDGQTLKRFCEPFSVGTHRSSGNYVLVAWHVYGFSKSQHKPQWRMYRLDKMIQTQVLKTSQRRNRPLYNPNDVRINTIATMADYYTTDGGDNFSLEKLKQFVKDKFNINPNQKSFMDKLKTSISKIQNAKGR